MQFETLSRLIATNQRAHAICGPLLLQEERRQRKYLLWVAEWDEGFPDAKLKMIGTMSQVMAHLDGHLSKYVPARPPNPSAENIKAEIYETESWENVFLIRWNPRGELVGGEIEAKDIGEGGLHGEYIINYETASGLRFYLEFSNEASARRAYRELENRQMDGSYVSEELDEAESLGAIESLHFYRIAGGRIYVLD